MKRPNRPGFVTQLKDGRSVFLGPVLPEDAWRLREGLKQMSPQSRYLRFFAGFSEFTPAQVRYFTEVDQVRHVAWGVLQADGPPWPGVAIARFAQLSDSPKKAEWAIAVIDAYQGSGLGTLLMATLYLEAEARRLEALTGLVLPENRFVLQWLINLGAIIDPRPEAYEIELPIDRTLLSRTDTGRRLLATMEEMAPRVRGVRRGKDEGGGRKDECKA